MVASEPVIDLEPFGSSIAIPFPRVHRFSAASTGAFRGEKRRKNSDGSPPRSGPMAGRRRDDNGTTTGLEP
ncbi:unnamed protein product, partial [Iphiclides podalirius]